jgi:DNA repair photolyase
MPSAHCLLIGALSDAYPPPESEFGITRAIVATLVAASERFTIVTKSELVLRDIDLLAAHADQAYVQVSICSTDDDVLRRLDPGAPTGTARFGVIAALRAAGVRVGLNVLPWIPGVTDTQALIARVPDDVEIVLAPLAFGEGRDRMRLLGREFTRHDVVEQYLDEYRRFGHVANTSWVRPSPPPEENHPMHRLPSLAVSA